MEKSLTVKDWKGCEEITKRLLKEERKTPVSKFKIEWRFWQKRACDKEQMGENLPIWLSRRLLDGSDDEVVVLRERVKWVDEERGRWKRGWRNSCCKGVGGRAEEFQLLYTMAVRQAPPKCALHVHLHFILRFPKITLVLTFTSLFISSIYPFSLRFLPPWIILILFFSTIVHLNTTSSLSSFSTPYCITLGYRTFHPSIYSSNLFLRLHPLSATACKVCAYLLGRSVQSSALFFPCVLLCQLIRFMLLAHQPSNPVLWRAIALA